MKKIKSTASPNNAELSLQKTIKLATKESIKKYYGKHIKHNLLSRNLKYQQNWFLICGLTGSGKSSLLKGSGINFQLSHTSQTDCSLSDNGSNVTWHFAKSSVWIDIPGSIMDENSGNSWCFLAESIRNVRPARPIDGLLLVVDVNKIQESDDQLIKSTGSLLRKRIYELVDIWEIEFPVYLILNHSDQLPGFKEYFKEQLQNDNNMILGATFSEKVIASRELILFNEKYDSLCNVLMDFRLDKLCKNNNDSEKKKICSFVFHFEELKIKIRNLISELFKGDDHGGSPFLRGFYFTCYNENNLFKISENLNCIQAGNTIINHPLNPHNFLKVPQDETLERNPQSKVAKAFFVSSLFNKTIVNDNGLVKPSRKKEKRDAIFRLIIHGFIIITAILIVHFYINNENSMEKLIDNTSKFIKTTSQDNFYFEKNYTVIDILKEKIERIQKYSKKYPLLIGFGFYRSNEVLSELENEYFRLTNRFIVIPASKYLEYNILKLSSSGNISGKEYKQLYTSLKAYLIISGVIPENTRMIDTSLLCTILLEGAEKSVSATMNVKDIPDELDKILQKNIDFYLRNFVTWEFKNVSVNKNILIKARNCLGKLPGAETLYESAISDIVKDVPKISLDNILDRKEDNKLLRSDNEISIIYTQDGWDKYVRKALMRTADNPFKNDWVIANPEEGLNNSVPDENRLYEELVEEYLKDLKEKWLTFISSIMIVSPRSISDCSVMLKKLQATNSELSVLFEAVAKLATIKNEECGNENLKNGIRAVIGKNCAAISKIIKFTDNKNQFQVANQISFDRNTDFFKFLNIFGNSSESQDYVLYKKKLSTIADELVTLEEQTEKYPEIFNGSNDDPLTEGYKWIKSAPFSIPDELQSTVLKLLIQPFEITGDLVTESVGEALNNKWYNDVYKIYVSEIRGKFPFEETDVEASFQEVMGFFRPKTGTYWGFKDRFLSNYLGDENGKFIQKPNGVIKIRINPEFYSSMETSKTISEIFFRPDGKAKSFDIRIQPNFSDKFRVNLEIASQKQSLISGTVVNINWPNENKTITLSLENQTGILQDLTFNGEWGLIKLLNSAKLSNLNNSTFMTRWLFNVQNIYSVNLDASVHISEQENPFTDTVIRKFSCPQKIINDRL